MTNRSFDRDSASGLLRVLWKCFSLIGFRSASKESNPPSREAQASQLRELLRNKLVLLNAEALKNGGEIPEEQLASVERMARAARLGSEINPVSKRLPLFLALASALSAVSMLLLIRVPETEIELNAEVSEFAFTLPIQQPLISRVGVTTVGISGLSAIRLSPEVIPGLTSHQSGTDATAIQLKNSSNSGASAINLAAVIPPQGTRVWLRSMQLPHTFRLSFKPAKQSVDIALRADLRGLLEVAAPGVLNRPHQYDFGDTGATMECETNADMMDMDFTPDKNNDFRFYPQVPAENLTLSRIVEFALPEKSVVESISTLLNGTLYMESLNGDKYELKPGERLEFASSIGTIETVKLQDDRILLKFRARVKGMSTGGPRMRRDLMPSLLQWLKARQPLSLMWGATLFLYGVIVSVFRWYQKEA